MYFINHLSCLGMPGSNKNPNSSFWKTLKIQHGVSIFSMLYVNEITYKHLKCLIFNIYKLNKKKKWATKAASRRRVRSFLMYFIYFFFQFFGKSNVCCIYILYQLITACCTNYGTTHKISRITKRES